MTKRTGIFGGSFDPVHFGHLRLARSFLNSGLIDNLLILLTPDPPHKQGVKKSLYHHRLEMLKIAFQNKKNVTISDLEKKLPQPSYSLQTVDHLQAKHPNTQFYLCMGEDSLQHFSTWFKYKEILNKIDLLIAERPGYNAENISEEIKNGTAATSKTW